MTQVTRKIWAFLWYQNFQKLKKSWKIGPGPLKRTFQFLLDLFLTFILVHYVIQKHKFHTKHANLDASNVDWLLDTSWRAWSIWLQISIATNFFLFLFLFFVFCLCVCLFVFEKLKMKYLLEKILISGKKLTHLFYNSLHCFFVYKDNFPNIRLMEGLSKL